ncbi:MAG: class II histone deacetylase, partial [Pseudomonadota bacterium]
MRTGFFWDERCFWHSGGDYAFMAPVGGLVQPMAGGGLPENPETKRRLKNLCEVTGLWRDLDMRHAPPATRDDLLRVHTTAYIDRFHDTAVAGGGELGLRAPFGADGFDIACLSAGLAKAALSAVLRGDLDNAYAL